MTTFIITALVLLIIVLLCWAAMSGRGWRHNMKTQIEAIRWIVALALAVAGLVAWVVGA